MTYRITNNGKVVWASVGDWISARALVRGWLRGWSKTFADTLLDRFASEPSDGVCVIDYTGYGDTIEIRRV